MVGKESKGMPVYQDPTSRKIISIGDESGKLEVWHPSNIVSRRLWGCLEILRDINDLLEDGASAKNSGKKKRKAKFIASYVHSLAKSVDELCKTIVGERNIRKQLEPEDIDKVRSLQEEFGEFVPFQWKSGFSNYRNKLVAHFDSSFWPKDASELLKSVPVYKIGQWLHICLHVILDLTKLNIYSWSCESGHDSYIKLMSNEPFIVTMKIDEETNNITQLAGVDIAKESPKKSIQEAISISIKFSQWMFKKGQPRIGNLKEDMNKNWNTFSEGKKNYETEI